MSTLQCRTFLLVVLEIFTEQFESRRYAQVQDHHLGRLVEIVSHRSGRCRDVVLNQARAIVGHIDGKWLEGWFLLPRQEIGANYLIGNPALAVKTNLDVARRFLINALQCELMEQIIGLRTQNKSLA